MLEIKSPHNQEKMGLTLLIIICIVVIGLQMTVHTFVQSQTHHKLRTKTCICTQLYTIDFNNRRRICKLMYYSANLNQQQGQQHVREIKESVLGKDH